MTHFGMENRWIVQVTLSTHDTIAACVYQAVVPVLCKHDIAVSKHRDIKRLFHGTYNRPVSQACFVALHFTCSSMYRRNLCPGTLDHASVCYALLLRLVHAKFGRYGHF